MKCDILKQMSNRIANGEDPNLVIPYHLNVDKETMIEVCYFAINVLPEGDRKEQIKKSLEELNASR